MKGIHWIAQAHPIRALIEAYVLGAAALVILLSLQNELAPIIVQQGLFFIGAGVTVWTALRMRRPSGRWYRRLLIELIAGVIASAPGYGFGLMRAGEIQPQLALAFFEAASAIGFVAFRVGVRVWLFWDRLRRKRLIWSITHAILSTVVLLALLLVMVLTLVASNYAPASGLLTAQASPFASFAARVVNFLLPLASMMVVLTTIALMMVLPPAIVFSFFVARGLTRRLEHLARTTRTVRTGDFAARVTVSGGDEVAQLQGDFNAMIADLERALHDLQAERDRVAALLDERRELIAGVSHELRTPVATLRGYLESALSNWDKTSPETLQRDLEIMDREAARLQALIDDLFTLARAEVGQLTMQRQPIDVGAIVRRVVETTAPLAWQSSRVEVAADVQSSACAMADEGRLEQVLRNLIHNGLRHTPPGGIVAAIVQAEAEAVIVEVRDTGEGIAPDDLPHVWERFYRAENSRARSDGAGLGLVLVKELTEAMGGSVGVESRMGEGSCFTVRLPRE